MALIEHRVGDDEEDEGRDRENKERAWFVVEDADDVDEDVGDGDCDDDFDNGSGGPATVD